MFSTDLTVERQAESLLKGTGPRQSAPRKRVLMFLLEQEVAVTRTDILAHMAGKPLGDATLHRVLAWLVANGLAHRIACAGRSPRFSASRDASREHAHFLCMKCGSVTCLHDVVLPADIAVPPGFKRYETDFLIKGACAHCSGK